MDAPAPSAAESQPAPVTRRSFLSVASTTLMGAGLTAGYGMFAWLIGWFLFPSKAAALSWQFVIDLNSIPMGGSLTYEAPAGQKVVVTRLQETGTADDFIALSSVCPHLGCQVHWEQVNNRFFCPCHNGAFDAQGVATSGPPADAAQSLAKYPLRVENGLLFIEAPMTALT